MKTSANDTHHIAPITRIALAALALHAIPALAQIPAPNLLVNPSFESPAFSSNQNLYGAFTLPGWYGEVGALSSGGNGGIVVGTLLGLAPADGRQQFCFNGANPPPGGYIEQSFATSPGATYALEYSLARIGRAGEPLHATASAFDAISGTTLATTDNDPGAPATYTRFSLAFTAISTTTRIRIADTSGANPNSDLFLDNASVMLTASAPLSAVPEPSTYAAICGSCVLGAAYIRRRRTRPHPTDLRSCV